MYVYVNLNLLVWVEFSIKRIFCIFFFLKNVVSDKPDVLPESQVTKE